MNKSLSLLVAAVLVLASCTPPFKKSPDGSQYKVISKNGKPAVKGNFMELQISAKYKDSVLFSTYEVGSPRYVPFDSAQLPVFLKTIKEGDSIVVRIATDSLIKRNQSTPNMKKGEFVYQYFKLTKLYTTEADAEKAAQAYEPIVKAKGFKKQLQNVEKLLVTESAQMKTDDAKIQDYLKKNNLTATKTKWGTYVVIIQPGIGANITEKDIVSVNYTGRNLTDSVFDSSTDPRFGHVEPYDLEIAQFGVIPGWIDGLLQLKKGSVAKFIIPSTLAYGKAKQNENIGENEILAFDIEVVDLLTADQFKAKMERKQAEMMQKQQEAFQKKQQKVAENKAGEEPTSGK